MADCSRGNRRRPGPAAGHRRRHRRRPALALVVHGRPSLAHLGLSQPPRGPRGHPLRRYAVAVLPRRPIRHVGAALRPRCPPVWPCRPSAPPPSVVRRTWGPHVALGPRRGHRLHRCIRWPSGTPSGLAHHHPCSPCLCRSFRADALRPGRLVRNGTLALRLQRRPPALVPVPAPHCTAVAAYRPLRADRGCL